MHLCRLPDTVTRIVEEIADTFTWHLCVEDDWGATNRTLSAAATQTQRDIVLILVYLFVFVK